MELQDKDLLSIQEVRSLLKQASEAAEILATFDQQKIDEIVKAMAEASLANAVRLAKMANEETGFGIWQDKVIKNVFGSMGIYDAIKDMRTIGVLHEDKEQKVMEIGIPVGVIAGIVPSTNPTSTVMYKAEIAIKSGNAIVFSPHPGAKNCTLEAVNILAKAAESKGCPKGAIACCTMPTMQGTKELLENENTKLILATGGYAMVKAAYSSGTPAIGVGAGNGPAFIDKTADVHLSVKRILDSKTFDNGTICASEQSIIVEKCMKDKVVAELQAQGGYFLNDEESKKLGRFILRANGTMNPAIVGKSVEHICKLAQLTNVPSSARVLIATETEVGHKVPYSREKLAPILAFYVEENIDDVLDKVCEILNFEGMGHTFSMHSKDPDLVKRFSLKVPASRILINTLGSLGGVGATTSLFPALTLGCGAVGGSSSSNNIGPIDLINIKRVAAGIVEMEQLRQDVQNRVNGNCGCNSSLHVNTDLVDEIVKKVMKQLI